MKFKSVQSFRSLSSLDRAITKNYLAMVFLNQSLYQQTSGVTYHEKHLFRFSSLYIYPSQTLGLLTIYNKFHKALHAEFIFAVSRKNMSIQVTFKFQIIGTISQVKFFTKLNFMQPFEGKLVQWGYEMQSCLWVENQVTILND